MFVSKIDEKNYLVKIPFCKEYSYFFDNNEDVLSFFRIIFGKLISKYKIFGDVVIDFYLDDDYGIILDIYQKHSYGSNINAKIIFHLNCKFLVEVDYFNYIGKGVPLYYYQDKFYKDFDLDSIDDGEIIYDNDEIKIKGIVLYS